MKEQIIGNFKFIETGIRDVIIIEQKKYGDERGYFMETYHYPSFLKAGITKRFVQENQSKSKKGVLRGLHYQTKNIQGKLVRVVKGEVFDVAVDLRKGSETYGLWEGVILSESNGRQFYVPEGFAHGFLVLSEEAEFTYKCTDVYNPLAEGGILWDDTKIDIKWPLDGIEEVLLSEKDKLQKTLDEVKIEFDV